eukprot:TRINITY_DN3662_c0_g3_i10.p2 TRINITY_DN3662_c0_g3~~TRINITY_DN3662_c0_g3_i10.p2  ORF type:complete len:113 (-),score=15.67 TRINITY_DN3662_c0_g3_i10:51-389(-)
MRRSLMRFMVNFSITTTSSTIFLAEIIRSIRDPEHPYTLEQLNVVREDLISVKGSKTSRISSFNTTKTKCLFRYGVQEVHPHRMDPRGPKLPLCQPHRPCLLYTSPSPRDQA